MAVERDLDKSEFSTNNNILFDVSGHFIMYPTMLGIKVINIDTNRCVSILGKTDNIRPLHIALFQVLNYNIIIILLLQILNYLG